MLFMNIDLWKLKYIDLSSDTAVSLVKCADYLFSLLKKVEYLGDFQIGCNEVKTQANEPFRLSRLAWWG